MAGVSGNRRTLYTKKVIKESLIELLKTREIHQVTVTDICKKADINRGTFYTHYKDAFDLFQSMEDELFHQILKTSCYQNIHVEYSLFKHSTLFTKLFYYRT